MDEVEYYIDILKNGGFSERIQAAYMLGEMGDERAIRPLVEVLRDAPWQLRREIVEALTKLKPREHMEVLLSCLMDRDPNVRNSAMEAITAIGEDVIDYLKELMKREEPEIRIYSVNALGNIGSKKAVDELIKALDEEKDPNVRYEIIEALGKIGDERALEPLISLLDKLEIWDQFPVVAALGKIGDERAVPKLIELLDVEELRAVVIEALGCIGSWIPFEKIASVLKETKDKDIIRVSLSSLHKIYVKTRIFTDTVGRWELIKKLHKILEEIPISIVSPILGEDLQDREEEFIKEVLFLLRYGKPEGDLPLDLILGLFHREEFEDELVEIFVKLYPYYKNELNKIFHETIDKVVLSGLLKVISFFPDPSNEGRILELLEDDELFESALGGLRLLNTKMVRNKLINYLERCEDPSRIRMITGAFLAKEDIEVVEFFRKKLQEKPLLSAVFFSVYRPDEVSPEEAFSLLDSSDPELIKAVLHLISNYPNTILENLDEMYIRKLLGLVIFDDFQVRMLSISILSNWVDKPFVREGLLSYLDDPNIGEMEKARILEVINGYMDDKDREFIVERLSSFSPPLLVSFSRIAHNFKGVDEVISILEDMLFEYDEDEVKGTILETLGILGDRDLLDILEDFSKEENWIILRSCVKSAILLGLSEEGCKILKKILDRIKTLDMDGKDIVVKEILDGFSKLRCPDVIPNVVEFLSMSSVAQEAFQTLVDLGKSDPESLIESESKVKDLLGRLFYIYAIFRVKPEGWIEVLEKYRNSPYPSLRDEASGILSSEVRGAPS